MIAIENVDDLKEFFRDNWELVRSGDNYSNIIKGFFDMYPIEIPDSLNEAIELIERNENNLYKHKPQKRVFYL